MLWEFCEILIDNFNTPDCTSCNFNDTITNGGGIKPWSKKWKCKEKIFTKNHSRSQDTPLQIYNILMKNYRLIILITLALI